MQKRDPFLTVLYLCLRRKKLRFEKHLGAEEAILDVSLVTLLWSHARVTHWTTDGLVSHKVIGVIMIKQA